MLQPITPRITGKPFISPLLIALSLLVMETNTNSQVSAADTTGKATPKTAESAQKLEKATFGAGCFWCTEAVFQRLKGVKSVVSGYSGGHVKNPTYEQVCTGTTGHAEAVQITFDPSQVSFKELLEVFWKTHDPTTLNRQGPDHGTQYRSAIFYHSEEQHQLAEKYKHELTDAKAFHSPIVTQIVPFEEFFPAENYHQDYFSLNSKQPYCARVIRPKVEKFEKVFHDKLQTPARPESSR